MGERTEPQRGPATVGLGAPAANVFGAFDTQFYATLRKFYSILEADWQRLANPKI